MYLSINYKSGCHFKVVTVFRECLIKLHLYLEVCKGTKDQHCDCEELNSETMASFRRYESQFLLPDFLLPLQEH